MARAYETHPPEIPWCTPPTNADLPEGRLFDDEWFDKRHCSSQCRHDRRRVLQVFQEQRPVQRAQPCRAVAQLRQSVRARR